MANIHEIIVKTKKALWRSSDDTVSFIIYYELCRVNILKGLPNSHSSIVDLGWASISEVELTVYRCTTESRHSTCITYSMELFETIEDVIYNKY